MANKYENIQDTFIDLKSSQAFDGHPPYAFRFEDEMSIGLFYVRPICFISKDQFVEISTPSNQNVFCPLKMDQNIPDHPIIHMNLNFYVDLETLIPENNTFVSEGFQYVTEYEDVHDQYNPGTPKDYFWVHMVYILGHASEPGEYLETFLINNQEYLILGDFYAENEPLKTNLQNLESKLPESIQKAIYENNVHEELADNILINRKNKELLMEYINIMANKGSTSSIINSINWFEWGDLLRLEEIWKRYINDNLDYDYFARIFDALLTPEDVNQLANHVKTTFLGLYCTLNKLQLVNGQVVYQDTFGRNNIQSMTSWQDQDASNRTLPSDYYNQYSELEPSSLAQVNSIDNEVWDDWIDDGISIPAEIATEQPMSLDQFLDPDNNPGIILPGQKIVGNWAKNEQTGEWIEVTNGNINDTWGQDWRFYRVNFNYIYAEHIPNLIKTLTLWTGQDLSLKMTVLGNFFSTFFMPIHMNLLHSCIEYWVYSYGLKHLYSQIIDEKSIITAFGGVDMVWESNGKIIPHPEMESWYGNILFRSTGDVFGYIESADDYMERLRNSTTDNVTQANIDIMKYYYKGPSCKVRFMGQINLESDDEHISLYKQRLVWQRESDIGEIESAVGMGSNTMLEHDPIPQYIPGHYVYIDGQVISIQDGPSGNAKEFAEKHLDTFRYSQVIDLDFYLGFKEEGDYVLYFEFYTSNNKVYSKKIRISVSDSISNCLEIKKLLYKDQQDWALIDSPLSMYQLAKSHNEYDALDVPLQSHYLSADPNNSTGLNHTLIAIIPRDYDGEAAVGGLILKTGLEQDMTSWEGSRIDWVGPAGNPATWNPEYGPDKWPKEWGEFTDEKSREKAGEYIPSTYKGGQLNSLINVLQETFPGYWWFWDRILVSERDNPSVRDDLNEFSGETVYINGEVYKGQQQQEYYPEDYN